MGNILKINALKTPAEWILIAVAVIAICIGVYFFAPGLLVGESLKLDKLTIDKEKLDNLTPEAKIEIATSIPSIDANQNPPVIIAGYAWNGETAIIAANGGPKTTKGSLMEINGVNLTIIKQDWLSELRAMQMKFIEQYDAGEEFPSSDKAAMGIMIMGDGVPFYISTMQSALNEKFGKNKYHVKSVGCVGGMSDGEDKVIGPRTWKLDPKAMIGCLISVVPGDGDWVVLLNFCFANNLKINPDFTTYDKDAINIFPSADDDYMNSAKELIASQKNGFTASLKVIKDGKLTGEIIDKKIDGCSTWTPGDKVVFDALSGFTDIASTKDFPNQMATSLVVFDEWTMSHEQIMSNILKSALTAANQIKQYDEWAIAGSDAVAKTFNLENGKYWYDMFKGQSGNKAGLAFNMGGTRVLNYADVMQYHGEGSDGINRYKSVYDQVSTYLTKLNPFGFNESVERVIPYEEAVNLTFLKNLSGMVQTTEAASINYSAEKTKVMAQGEWSINFATGSATIQSTSTDDIKTIYGILMQAEQTKIKIIGHTDNTGNPGANMKLSDLRANSVAESLLAMGISVKRFQVVEGKGDTAPIADNNTTFGKSQNRRVEIVLLQ